MPPNGSGFELLGLGLREQSEVVEGVDQRRRTHLWAFK
jgi:hypothetical protein